MNKYCIKVPGILFALLFIVAPLFGQNREPDREKISRLHQKDLSASISGDVDSLISLWDENGLMLPPKDEPVSGIDAITKYLCDAHSKRGNIDLLEYKHDFRELNIVNNMAFEWGYYKNKVRVIKNGNIITVNGKLFRVLRKNEDGEWKVYRAMWTTDSIDKE